MPGSDYLIPMAYLVASIVFVLGLKGLTHPRTAVRGNTLGAIGMLIAIVATLCSKNLLGPGWVIAGVSIGVVAGALFAIRVQMTQMPQLVALFNGLGGGASALVAGAALITAVNGNTAVTMDLTIPTFISGVIGAITLTGSIVAFLKLHEVMKENFKFPGQGMVNALLGLACLGLGLWIMADPDALFHYWVLVGIASILGVLLVVPIGGADMPVVIALLNSYSGLAAAATGFVVNNNVLIIAGSLVGASGLILCRIMCKAMNRSLVAVLFGTMDAGGGDIASADEVYAGKVKSAVPDEVAMLFDTARRVVIVPGYGMAVAQCQHTVRDLANLLEARDINVEFGIHPVAGRMPGHMNVLLAEADIPYDKLIEMDVINPQFDQVDVTIVVGANDVVNPTAPEPIRVARSTVCRSSMSTSHGPWSS